MEAKLFKYSIQSTSLPYQTKDLAAQNSRVLSLWSTHKHQKLFSNIRSRFPVKSFFTIVKFIYTSLTCKQLQEFLTWCHVCLQSSNYMLQQYKIKKEEKKSVMHVSTYTRNSMQLPSTPRTIFQKSNPTVATIWNRGIDLLVQPRKYKFG